MNKEDSILDIDLEQKIETILQTKDESFVANLIGFCQKIRKFYLIVIAFILIMQVTLGFAWVSWADFLISLILSEGDSFALFKQKAMFHYHFSINYYLLKFLFLFVFLFISCFYQLIKILQTTWLIRYIKKSEVIELKNLNKKFNQVFKGYKKSKSDKYKNLYLVMFLLYLGIIFFSGFVPWIWKASVRWEFKENFDFKLAQHFN